MNSLTTILYPNEIKIDWSNCKFSERVLKCVLCKTYPIYMTYVLKFSSTFVVVDMNNKLHS
jgi:hypothetical protein